MRCLYAASEVAGFAKTGGLADVAGSLPRALAEHGIDTAVILPLYHCVRTGPIPIEPTEHTFAISFGDRPIPGRLWRSVLPGSKVPVFLVEQAELFERDDDPKSNRRGRGIYQFAKADNLIVDYADNDLRFAFFSRAILEAIRLLDFWPDVLHLNDWQTGLVPVYLREVYRQTGRRDLRQNYERIRTLFTIHNLAYQGLFDHAHMPLLGLPWRLFNYQQLEFFDHINFLKGGLVFADLLNTVSPTYAREIQTSYFGCGLQGVLLQRTRDLTGIVNGVDYEQWDPARDKLLPVRYGPDDVVAGKAQCKAHLQKSLGLELKPDVPLLGIVTRLVDQKGLDLIRDAAPMLLREGVQFAVLGQGSPIHHTMLLDLQSRFPGQTAVRFVQDERMAHLIEAGSDIFLMPSQFEPCGLSQLYSLRYGTVPVVRATGGLSDTVVDASPKNLAAGKATGFSFIPYGAADFLEAVHRALELFRKEPASWLALQQTGMKQDWSWNRSACDYQRLYQKMAAMRPEA